ncbi:hypothetical protein Tco_1236933 [Tanacetum coccineum]
MSSWKGYCLLGRIPQLQNGKLDSFLVTEGIISLYPSISALCLDRHLSDHRPILLREVLSDFGPTPFRFYQSWLRMEGFDSMVEHAVVCFSHYDYNAMVRWVYLLDILHAFGFGPNWCRWIRGTFTSSMASILVNGSPTSEFPFCCGLKQDVGCLKAGGIGSGVCLEHSFRYLGCDGLGSVCLGVGLGGLVNNLQARVPKGCVEDYGNLPCQILQTVLILRIERLRGLWDALSSIMNSVVLSSSKDRWTCDLSGDGEFKVKVIRNFIDDLFLPSSDVETRWVKFIPIKVNVFLGVLS